VSQVVNLPSHSDHDDRPKVLAAELTSVITPEKHIVVSIYRAPETFSSPKSIQPICLRKYGEIWSPRQLPSGRQETGWNMTASIKYGRSGNPT